MDSLYKICVFFVCCETTFWYVNQRFRYSFTSLKILESGPLTFFCADLWGFIQPLYDTVSMPP